MLDTDISHDSLLAGAFGPTLLVDLTQDIILAATPEAGALFRDQTLVGSHFARFVASGMDTFVVFIAEVQHRGTAWTRRVTLQSAAGEPLQCEVTGRALRHDGTDMLLLHALDLAGLEQHAAEVAAGNFYQGGLMEWQRAQSFFADLERENQLILNAAGEGIYGVNADGKTTFVNRAAQEMLGWSTEDLLGKDIHSMIHHHHVNGDIYPSQQCPIYRSFRFEQVNRIEDEVFWRKDGEPIRVEYVSTPIYDQKLLVGAVVIFRDITDRKENERKLQDALQEVALLRDQLEQENAYLQEAITSERAHHDIIGVSPAIQQIVARIDLVAKTDATVFITGETGTGKSLVATEIHKSSQRAGR